MREETMLREYTEPECEFFRAQCNFTADEREVFDLRVKDVSIVAISLKMSVSESTVNRLIKRVKKKIHRVL